MSKKILPMDGEHLAQIAAKYGTPFHIYSEQAIREQARRLNAAFSWAPAFKEYFAVKALPNPYIIKILREEGCGADCSSLAELVLAEKVGMSGDEICFTANDMPASEFVKARELGAVINLDDITHLSFLKEAAGLPDLISFRYNPGEIPGGGNEIIGTPSEAKYGLTYDQLILGIIQCISMGITRFGLHTMIVSNERSLENLLNTAEMMFSLAASIKEMFAIDVEFINLGGGIGIPYLPEQEEVDLEAYGQGIQNLYRRLLLPADLKNVKICMESGRMMTGPYGWLVSTVLHKKDTYKQFIGLDSSMADLMRPALYGAYHHISVVGKEDAPCDHKYDVTGSLCENNDKFAIDRMLPEIKRGDLLVIHDTGAHGYAMGFNYNGKLRSQELLLKADGTVKQIRRAETLDDYFATLDFSEL